MIILDVGFQMKNIELKSGTIISEKSLVDRAIDLRTELENAASDISSLYAKIGGFS